MKTRGTTKGQVGGDVGDSASIFRKVRLANPKIKAVLVDVAGAIAIDVMMLHEEDGESFLIIPKGKSSVVGFVLYSSNLNRRQTSQAVALER